ncbi:MULTISPECIES: thermonuclease family protein [unclassified Helicobacter]|uniref:thermonuclease family protein n=1 Tax=unclassified Helicobacter TaxID=2593540 RepID=UPI0015F14D80|nr:MULTISPECIES: thermonuclease family protein [unclassified Helicobacter]
MGRKNILAIVGFVAIISASLGLNINSTENIQGKIIKVYDGDTITLDIGDSKKTRIRLYGIDAPESDQSFGKQSQENLLATCPLESIANVSVKSKDRYGRLVGVVYCNGVDANKKQVVDGFAWAYKEFSTDYIREEISARLDSRGLWSEKNPVYPQEYRKENKKRQQKGKEAY